MTFMPGKDHSNYKHGHRPKNKSSKTYITWVAMIARCNPINAEDNPKYSGSGISVCQRWKDSFENFLNDMGERPPRCTIDRIDPSGNYEPSNCRWATAKQQAQNRRNNVFTEINGEFLCLKDISEKYGIPSTTVYRRYNQGVRGIDLISRVNRNSLRTGEKAPGCKIKDSDVKIIKEMIENGAGNKEIASFFNVSCSVISEIRNGKSRAEIC